MSEKPTVNIIAIIQARMASSRLPGKVLSDIAGMPMLVRVYERANRSNLLNGIVVATTKDKSDDPIANLCTERGYPCFRGNQFDVLDRYYQAAIHYKADVIVRLTADCPLIDAEEIDHVIWEFLEGNVDFATNRLPPPWKRSYPIGLDTEVCSFNALKRAWQEAKEPYEREHVMPYLYNAPGRFRILALSHTPDYGNLRWTVDTPEDLELIRVVYQYFRSRENFGWKDVLALFMDHPDLVNINSNVQHKGVMDVDKRMEENR